jgi:hypothetical protein
MRAVARRLILPGLLLVGVAGCSDPTQDGAHRGDIIGVDMTVVAGSCDLTAGLAQDASGYFSPTDVQLASGLVKDLTAACNAGNAPIVRTVSILLLNLVETALNSDRGGNPAIGSDFVNAVLACTASLCNSAILPGIDFSIALSPFGLFAVRTTGTNSVLARGAIPFADFQGNPNSAQWGVEVDLPWNQVTFVNPTILYGGPVLQAGVSLDELGIGDLQYRMDVFPDAGQFLDGALHVSVCFAADVDVPASSVGLEARMQREGVVLEEHVPGFCPVSTAQTASVISPFVALAKRVLPATLRSVLFADTRVRVVGGTPLDFSRFAPIAAQTDGTLEFVTTPPSVVTEGVPLPTIQVLARSGNGTPMEVVDVTLSLRRNNGVPAGAVLSGDKQSPTREQNGLQGIATFPDDGNLLIVGKPGGYLLCANGILDQFTFEEICAAFHARNANRN